MVTDDDGNSRVLPSGLVTFVFTDIEASTRLYKTVGEDVAGRVFDLHNDVLRSAWLAHDGHEVHTEGDSFFVVFEDPRQAVAACIEAQQHLSDTKWPPGGEVRVRIGLHCGLAAPRNDDYMSLAVHQAARVMSAANGDQILVTDAILQRLDPINGVTITRTGSFRLRDFDQAPVLHRIDVDSRPFNDHPPRATPASHHNLVPQLTSFVGRSADVVAVNGLLEQGKAVTLVGLGGIGKTRLATEVGLEVASTWEHGAWMVGLAEVVDPDLIAEEVAISIGVDTAGVGDRWNDVLEFIGDKSMLLILDNIEHLIDETARLIPELLRSCPNTAVLNTSREPLNCQGEVVYRVRPLELSFDVDDPTQLPPVELFIDRARAVSVDFVWTDEALTNVVEICRHLDGFPLAIEIAAAQIGVLQLTEIKEGLGNRFRLLRSRDRALPERQRTMEGLLGWSYQLLNDTEQRAFRRLAVFAGSFSIDAAEAALASDGIDAEDVPELIWTLVDKSLIAADLSDSATRYRLFESVQQYSMRLLIDNDDPVRFATALGGWLLDRAAPWHVNDRRWLGNVAIELANIRKIVDLVAQVKPEMAQQLMVTLGRYHDAVQSYRAGVESLTRAAAALVTPTPSRVALLVSLAELHLRTGDIDAAEVSLDEARRTESQVGTPRWDDVALDRLAGEIATRRGQYELASQIAETTLERDLSDLGSARMWSLLGIARCALGNLDEGQQALEKALAIYVDVDQVSQIGIAHSNVAEAAWRRGDVGTAAKHQRACLENALTIGQRVVVGYSLIMAAHIAAKTGEWATAIQLRAAAEMLVLEAGHQLYEDDQAAFDAMTKRASSELGSAVADIQLEYGREMDIIDAAALATALFQSHIQPIHER